MKEKAIKYILRKNYKEACGPVVLNKYNLYIYFPKHYSPSSPTDFIIKTNRLLEKLLNGGTFKCFDDMKTRTFLHFDYFLNNYDICLLLVVEKVANERLNIYYCAEVQFGQGVSKCSTIMQYLLFGVNEGKIF